MPDALMGPDEVADYLGVPKTTLYAWRHHGGGPRSIKVGRHLRYRLADVDAWLDEQADEPAPAAARWPVQQAALDRQIEGTLYTRPGQASQTAG